VVASVSLRAGFFVAIVPLLLGSVVLTRFDLWPTVLTAAAVALLLAGRRRFGLGVLGVAAAAKLYPAVLLPIALVHVWRTRGRREAIVCGGIFAIVVAVIVLPFAVVAPGGVWDSFWVQAGRPLQIESFGAGILLAAHQALGLDLTMESGHGSQNLAGGAADTLAVATTLAQIAAVIGIWIWYARGPADRDRLVRACAAAVCAFIAFGKVLSPQFLIWLLPLVPLVRGRRGLAAGGLLAAALVLTQLWFPYRYWELALELDAAASWLVLLRDIVLIALVGVLTVRARGERARSA
jgi:Glycosyltransferase family 87